MFSQDQIARNAKKIFGCLLTISFREMRVFMKTLLFLLVVLATSNISFAQSVQEAAVVQKINEQTMADEITELGFTFSPSALDEAKFAAYLQKARGLDVAMEQELSVMKQQFASRLAELSNGQGSKEDRDKKQEDLVHDMNAATTVIVNKIREQKRYLFLRTFKD